MAGPTSTSPTISSTDLAVRAKKERRQSPRSDYRILVVQIGANQFGMIVDDLYDSGEVVVKPLSSFANASGCFAGSTITGDGRVILILDVGGVATRAKLEAVDDHAAKEQAAAESSLSAARQSIILFRHGAGELLAVRQERLLRLEKARPEQIERVGQQEFVQYQGAALPVIRLNTHLPLNPLPEGAKELFLLIPKRPGRQMAGILASSIEDALDVNVTVQPSAITGPGIQGTAVVNGKLALFLDPELLLDAVLLEKSA
jgi:two-component system chemotaxis sensor kinase CheA